MAYSYRPAVHEATITGTETIEPSAVPLYYPVSTFYPSFPSTVDYCFPTFSAPLCCVTSAPYQSYVTTNSSGNSSCTTVVPNQITETTINNKTGMAYTASNCGNAPAPQQFDPTGNTINADGSINAPWMNNRTEKPRIIHDREKVPVGKTQYTPGTPTPLQFGSPFSQGRDPGVQAVSQVLFEGNGAFRSIPLSPNPTVFRRRRGGDCSSQWSNAFASKIDPCECPNPEVAYNTEIDYNSYSNSYNTPAVEDSY